MNINTASIQIYCKQAVYIQFWKLKTGNPCHFLLTSHLSIFQINTLPDSFRNHKNKTTLLLCETSIIIIQRVITDFGVHTLFSIIKMSSCPAMLIGFCITVEK